MRVCMILEGSYPYVNGGVSSWMHQYINAMPDVEFVLWCIGAYSSDKDNFKYEIPKNVVEIKQVFLNDYMNNKAKGTKNFSEKQLIELNHLVCSERVDWSVIFDMCRKKDFNPTDLLESRPFWEKLRDLCLEKYPYVSYADFFHTIRSTLLPELYLLSTEVPEADIYHSTATGYAGLLGSLGSYLNNKKYVVTEHGIYTREREEELLRARWVQPAFRQQWIELFYNFSLCAYQYADKVTALFARANVIQHELGCDPRKNMVIANGVHLKNFMDIPPKENNGYIDIGAVVRIAPIKDIKTMLYAFHELNVRINNTRLFILGGVDDEDYMQECKELIEVNHIENVFFTGMVNVKEYFGRFDFTILTSISEGQPLSVLESFAAHRPVVTTDVGCCRDLLNGTNIDDYGEAGYCVPPMHKIELMQAMYRMCVDEKKRLEMGEVAFKRVSESFTHESSMKQYRDLYNELLNN